MPSKSSSSLKITEHYLVPKHRILSLEESVEVLKNLGIKPWQLPRISINDPIVKILNGKPGDIIEIDRNSPTAGKYKAYRIVVSY
ncbi:MAG: DNA-directed RNA polymerase subunit H [Caldisphaera sp.]|nr:DNA-directed RNA polymerase subunit H [Caldisphaera sp.]